MDEEEFSYEVRIWAITEHVSTAKAELAKPFEKRKRTFSVRWRVATERQSLSFATFTLAERYRNKLKDAAAHGEAFHIATGLPASEYRKKAEAEAAERAAAEAAAKAATCYTRFVAFFDRKWPTLADKARANLADALGTVTAALVADDTGKPDRTVLNHVLVNYVYNLNNRNAELPSAEHVAAKAWIEANSLSDVSLAEDATVRTALEAIRLQPTTGLPAALVSVRRKRAGLNQALEYLVESGVLDTNPLSNPKWRDYGKGAKRQAVVDRAVVANPRQVEAMITKVGEYGKYRDNREYSPRLQAFFALLYYCSMRPSEALDTTEDAFDLPPAPPEGRDEIGWGTVRLRTANPQAESLWTTTGGKAASKSLKQRTAAEWRDVPIPPRAVYWVRRHIETFKIKPGAQMFVGPTGGMVGKTMYARVWRFAREKALTPKQFKSPLARRPYDLRHGGVSLLLNAGVPPTLVAEWAGHSIEVLLRTYAKCIDGQEDLARRLVTEALAQYLDSGSTDAEEPVPTDDSAAEDAAGEAGDGEDSAEDTAEDTVEGDE